MNFAKIESLQCANCTIKKKNRDFVSLKWSFENLIIREMFNLILQFCYFYNFKVYDTKIIKLQIFTLQKLTHYEIK